MGFNIKPASAQPRQTPNFRTIPNNTQPHWWRDPSLRWNMFHLFGLCFTLFTNGYCGSILNGLQSVEQWKSYFGHPDATTIGLMNCAGFLPGIVVSFVSDRIGNRFGRRIPIYMGTVAVMIGSVIMVASRSVGMYCGGRAVLGLGNYTVLTMSPALLQEIAHPRLRAQMGAFFMSIYYIAALICAAVCLGCLSIDGQASWRVPIGLQLVFPIITLLILPTMPESPRWLAKKGREAEARQVLVRYHANGKEDDELVEHEFRGILAALRAESVSALSHYSDFVRCPGNRRRLAIILWVSLGTNWSGNGVVGYYLSPVLDSLGFKSSATQLEVLLGMHIWNAILAILAAMSVEWIGRRPLWLMSTGGMLVSTIFIMVLSCLYQDHGNTAAGVAVLPFLFLLFGSYDIAWTPLSFAYVVEILPFSLRTKGQAIFIALQASGIAINTFVNPVAINAIQWKFYGVYVGFLVASVVMIWVFFPETKGMTIEEISLLFDDNNASVTNISINNTAAIVEDVEVNKKAGEPIRGGILANVTGGEINERKMQPV